MQANQTEFLQYVKNIINDPILSETEREDMDFLYNMNKIDILKYVLFLRRKSTS